MQIPKYLTKKNRKQKWEKNFPELNANDPNGCRVKGAFVVISVVIGVMSTYR